MIGRPRKHKTNAARRREYRLRQRQLRILLSVPNPEPGSIAWRVQYAEAVRRIRAASEPKVVAAPLPTKIEAAEPAPTPNPPVLVDDMRDDLPPRSPAEIHELLKIETSEQTSRRIENDMLRHLNQRCRRTRRGVDASGEANHADEPLRRERD